MKLSLIPRIKVNYSFISLLKAVMVSERRTFFRDECKAILSDFYQGENVCLVPSARDAIYELVTRLPQKKVIIPTYTCIAVDEAICLSGKEIVYSKTDRNTFNASYVESIDSNTIVLATHQYGLPCDIETIALKCKHKGAILIEDCATSMGTVVKGKMTGTFGDYAVVSFNASKMLNVPPFGGVLIGKNAEMLNRIEKESEWGEPSLRFKIKGLIRGAAFVLTKNDVFYRIFHYITIQSKGKFQKTEHEQPSRQKTALYSYKFSEWQASILLKQLLQLKDLFEKRKELYKLYNEQIINPLVKKPVYVEDAVCCRYAILVEKRNEFYHECVKKGVDMDFSHCSLACPKRYEDEYKMASHILNIPFNTNLTKKEVSKVIEVVNSIIL